MLAMPANTPIGRCIINLHRLVTPTETALVCHAKWYQKPIPVSGTSWLMPETGHLCPTGQLFGQAYCIAITFRTNIPTHLSQFLSHGIGGLKSADKTRKKSRSLARLFGVRPGRESCATHPTAEPVTKPAATRKRTEPRDFIDYRKC